MRRNGRELVGTEVHDLDQRFECSATIDARRLGPLTVIEDDGDATDLAFPLSEVRLEVVRFTSQWTFFRLVALTDAYLGCSPEAIQACDRD